MKLTNIKKKIDYSILNSIQLKSFDKIVDLMSLNVHWKIRNEIRTPNTDSIQDMQIRILNNLQNEIN